MRSVAFTSIYAIVSLLFLIGIAGCGANTGTGSSSYGADAGSWPQSPNRTPAAATPAANAKSDEPPNVPLLVVLRATSAENEQLLLDVAGVDLKYGNQWVPAATKATMADAEVLPLKATEKGISALLANKPIPKRKYTHVRLTLTDKKTQLTHKDEASLPLTLSVASISLKEWTPDEESDKQKTNLLLITLDGTKVKKEKDSATLPADAITVQTTPPVGGISGKLDPPTANARIEALWGASKVSLGSAIPDAQTGAFTISPLPPGAYRLDFKTPGKKLIEPLKDAIAVESKLVALKALALTQEIGRAHV